MGRWLMLKDLQRCKVLVLIQMCGGWGSDDTLPGDVFIKRRFYCL